MLCIVAANAYRNGEGLVLHWIRPERFARRIQISRYVKLCVRSLGRAVRRLLPEILRGEMIHTRRGSPANAGYSCLRHYGNQFYHSELDRTLGLALLDYALHDKLPSINQVRAQRDVLRPLGRMLELSGHQVSFTEDEPMKVSKGGAELKLGSIHGLHSNRSKCEHPLAIVHGPSAEIINEFLLTRNLPAVHRMIAAKFPHYRTRTFMVSDRVRRKTRGTPIRIAVQRSSGVRPGKACPISGEMRAITVAAFFQYLAEVEGRLLGFM